MALQVDREQLDSFCLELFRTLDGLGLLPRQLRVKPNEFEKYPRLLFGCVQRYNDVDAGFKEWESRILRDAPYRKEEHYPGLEALRRWMVNNEGIFTKKLNQQHLRTSLYARVFNYLYPRRVLANAYCVTYKGETEVAAKFSQFANARSADDKQSYQGVLEDVLNSTFPGAVLDTVARVKETYSDEWETIVEDARSGLIAGAAYYARVLRGKEPVVAPNDGEQAEPEDSKEGLA